jgi:LmbE family N-acetylglucosaminyl deacetylase
MAISVNLDVPASALAIGAHPDDVEFGCGATLAKWAAAGCAIHHLICTDGSKGTWDPDADTDALVTTRQEEQRRASQILGGTGDAVFLGWPDGELESDTRPRWQVAYWIRKIRPHVVLGHDPWRRYRLHPDHRNAGFLVTDGIVAARDPHFFPEQGIPPHRPRALLLWEADQPDHVEDVADQTEVKLAALLAHRSQFRSTMHIDIGDIETGGIDNPAASDELERFRDRVRQRLAEHGALAGFAQGEAFKLLNEL